MRKRHTSSGQLVNRATKHTRQAWQASGHERAVACNFCGANDGRLLAVENGYPVVRCAFCGLIYVNPQPTSDDLHRFYNQYYPEESGELWGQIMNEGFDKDTAFVCAAHPKPGRALDIGCGHGSFLARLARNGWKVTGLDLSEEAIRGAKALHGIEVLRGMFPERLFEAEAFDFVSAWYVLEHVQDPTAFVHETHRVLKPGGLFGLRVPNMDFAQLFLLLKRVPRLDTVLCALHIDTDGKSSHFNILDPPAHLYGYTAGTIKQCLVGAGFKDVLIQPAKPVDVGTLGTRVCKRALYSVTTALYHLSGRACHVAPALTVFARKPWFAATDTSGQRRR